MASLYPPGDKLGHIHIAFSCEFGFMQAVEFSSISMGSFEKQSSQSSVFNLVS